MGHLRTFRARLGAIVGAALVIRLLYVFLVTRHQNDRVYDATWYARQSLNLAEGHFFPVVFGPHGPGVGADAAHPPLVPILLAPVTWIFGLPHDVLPQRLVMVVLGAAVVLLVGLLGRRVGGATIGLVAAGIAAVAPNFWMPSGIVMSETVGMALMALMLLAVYRLLRDPTRGNAALMGLTCGLSLLVRAEGLLLIPMLVLPAVLVVRSRSFAERLRLGAVALIVIALVIAPWVIRNAVTFREPTLLSTATGALLLGGSCDETFYGPLTGGFSLDCQFSSLREQESDDQSVGSARQTDMAVRYLEDHLRRLPVVMAARVGRMWGLYRPVQMAKAEVNEGRPEWASLAGLGVYYLVLAAAVGGVVAFRRRKVVQWPLLVPLAAVTLVAVVGFGLMRYRASAEVPLVVLAAAGLVFGWERLVAGRRARVAASS